MRGEFQGAFGELQSNVNQTMANLRSVLGEVRAAIDTINGGAGEMRMASSDLSKPPSSRRPRLRNLLGPGRDHRCGEELDRAVERCRQESGLGDGPHRASLRRDRPDHRRDHLPDQPPGAQCPASRRRAPAMPAGFAVVAQEVRELAQRSAGAAKDIKALISGRSGPGGAGDGNRQGARADPEPCGQDQRSSPSMMRHVRLSGEQVRSDRTQRRRHPTVEEANGNRETVSNAVILYADLRGRAHHSSHDGAVHRSPFAPSLTFVR